MGKKGSAMIYTMLIIFVVLFGIICYITYSMDMINKSHQHIYQDTSDLKEDMKESINRLDQTTILIEDLERKLAERSDPLMEEYFTEVALAMASLHNRLVNLEAKKKPIKKAKK
jgi:archaellum component FlaC